MGPEFFLNTDYLLLIVMVLFISYKCLRHASRNKTDKSKRRVTARRPLGKFEEIMYYRSQKRQGTADISLTLCLRSNRKLCKEQVREALLVLAKKQPMLRAVIETNSSLLGRRRSEFIIVDTHDVGEMVHLQTINVKAGDWPKVWHDLASKRRETGRLWTVVLLQEEFLPETKTYANTLIFNFGHVCIDGVSCMKLCKQFLTYLNKISQGLCADEDEQSSLRLIPSFTDLLKNGRPWSVWKLVKEYSGISYLSKMTFRKTLRCFLAEKKHNPLFGHFFRNDPESSGRPMSQMIFKTFSKCETAKIVKACRENGSTVTGAMMTAAHLAFCELIQDVGCSVEKEAHLEHGFAINGQRDCSPKPPDDYLGEFAVGSPAFYMPYVSDVKNADFWTLARAAAVHMRSLAAGGRYVDGFLETLDSFSLEEYVDEIFSPVHRRDLIRRAFCNFISSAGSFDFAQEGKKQTYDVHECVFNTLVTGYSTAFSHYSTTVNGRMSWAILYDSTKILRREQAERFANSCFSYFVKLGQEQK